MLSLKEMEKLIFLRCVCVWSLAVLEPNLTDQTLPILVIKCSHFGDFVLFCVCLFCACDLRRASSPPFMMLEQILAVLVKCSTTEQILPVLVKCSTTEQILAVLVKCSTTEQILAVLVKCSTTEQILAVLVKCSTTEQILPVLVKCSTTEQILPVLVKCSTTEQILPVLVKCSTTELLSSTSFPFNSLYGFLLSKEWPSGF
jgi:mannitol/fructose-specific phosphotransferase system IIA component (Ntr-type)